jgi:hypothetical protein
VKLKLKNWLGCLLVFVIIVQIIDLMNVLGLKTCFEPVSPVELSRFPEELRVRFKDLLISSLVLLMTFPMTLHFPA